MNSFSNSVLAFSLIFIFYFCGLEVFAVGFEYFLFKLDKFKVYFFLLLFVYFYLTTMGLKLFLFLGVIDLPGLENGDNLLAYILSRQSRFDVKWVVLVEVLWSWNYIVYSIVAKVLYLVVLIVSEC